MTYSPFPRDLEMGKMNSRTVPKKPWKNLLVILKIYVEVVPYYCSVFLEGLVFKFKLLDWSIGFNLHIKSAIRFTILDSKDCFIYDKIIFQARL